MMNSMPGIALFRALCSERGFVLYILGVLGNPEMVWWGKPAASRKETEATVMVLLVIPATGAQWS